VTAVPRAIGKLERFCWERHERDLALSSKIGGHPRGLRFDAAAGDRVVQFVEDYCKHHKGAWAGKPMLLEEWQKRITRCAFGWLRADGTRRFRTMYVEIGRKNGKSQIAAALGLYLVIADGEEGAEVYSSATKKDQAKIVWNTACAMVKKSPDLKRFARVFQASIAVERTGSMFAPLGADSQTLDGLNPHGNIIDELHAHRDRGVWDVLDSAMGARRQPMTIAITTAGVYDKESIGWEMHDYATKVLDGTFEDDAFFAFIATPDEGDDHFSPVAQQKANPNYGVSTSAEYLEKQAEKAQRQPGFLNEYLTKHLNVWSQQSKRWLMMDKWAACEPQPRVGVDLRTLDVAREVELDGQVCRGGLDLSSKLDLTALVLEFAGEGDELTLLCRFWLPEERVKETAKKGLRYYETWQREGWLRTTPGDVVDYEFIREEIKALSKRFVLKELAFDPWGAMDLATRLTGDGLTMVECRQGYKTLSEPCKDLEARIVSGKVRHGNNPVLRWNAANAIVTTDAAGNIKPDKAKASERIDGIVAWAMARSRAIVAVPDKGTAYEDRGFLSLDDSPETGDEG
jgi:phage terminase large subunit-like protein